MSRHNEFRTCPKCKKEVETPIKETCAVILPAHGRGNLCPGSCLTVTEEEAENIKTKEAACKICGKSFKSEELIGQWSMYRDAIPQHNLGEGDSRGVCPGSFMQRHEEEGKSGDDDWELLDKCRPSRVGLSLVEELELSENK